MDSILEKIGQLAVFLICAQTLIHFRAADSYEKYIKLLVSLMLLILLFGPLGAIFGGESTGDLAEKIWMYEQGLQETVLNPTMQEEDIQVMIDSITEKKIREGIEYAEGEETGKDSAEDMDIGPSSETEAVTVEIETISIEKVEWGGQYGKSAENP